MRCAPITPRDQKAVRTAAETFVPNPTLDVAEVISQLGVGEALVSTLQEKGVPMPVERTLICPPRCRMGAITPEERAAVRARSPMGAKYDTRVNRESAYEILSRRAAAAVAPAAQPAPAQAGSGRTGPPADPLRPGSRPRAAACWGICCGAPSAARAWWKPWPSRRRAPSAARSAGRSCAACWVASSAVRAASLVSGEPIDLGRSRRRVHDCE